jgi:uncharacterized protein
LQPCKSFLVRILLGTTGHHQQALRFPETMSDSNHPSGALIAHPIRFGPGIDIVPAMEQFAEHAMKKSGTSSAFVLSAVGSLESVQLRLANVCKQDGTTQNDIKEWKQRLEIVSLVGTFSSSGKHLHMSVSDGQGNAFGGHLLSGKIFTTLELVVGTIQQVDFSREIDPATGFDELVVRERK